MASKTLVYQLWPLAWNGLKEMSAFLPRIAALDVDYVWLSPVYRSPQYDHGYDVASYKRIDHRIGNMHDFDDFVEAAHTLGIRVVMDLPINHTSTSHTWFLDSREYYCWSEYDRPKWRNLFAGSLPMQEPVDLADFGHPGWHIRNDPGAAWSYDKHAGKYYLHLFHEEMADLNWFPNGKLNYRLVYEFQEIIDFWTELHGVDGFRIDFPQGINKDFDADTLELDTLLWGDKSLKVINAIFSKDRHRNLFVMAEVFDPTLTRLVEYYAENSVVDFVINPLLKDRHDELCFFNDVSMAVENPKYMLDFESHDSPRFSRSSAACRFNNACMLFGSGAQGVCLYQGEELGLANPTKKELPDELMCKLDAMTDLRHKCGENLDDLRPTSRANARIHLPMSTYARQEMDSMSCLSRTKRLIQEWRNSG